MSEPFRGTFEMPLRCMAYSCGCATADQLHLSLGCCYRRGNGIHVYAVREDCCACCRRHRGPSFGPHDPVEPVKHAGPCHFNGARP